MSHFYMFFSTKVNVKMANVNMGQHQGIMILLCCFPKFRIIYPVKQVCYFSSQPSNTISLGELKCYVGFKDITYKTLEQCDFVYPQDCS